MTTKTKMAIFYSLNTYGFLPVCHDFTFNSDGNCLQVGPLEPTYEIIATKAQNHASYFNQHDDEKQKHDKTKQEEIGMEKQDTEINKG